MDSSSRFKTRLGWLTTYYKNRAYLGLIVLAAVTLIVIRLVQFGHTLVGALEFLASFIVSLFVLLLVTLLLLPNRMFNNYQGFAAGNRPMSTRKALIIVIVLGVLLALLLAANGVLKPTDRSSSQSDQPDFTHCVKIANNEVQCS